MSVQPGTCEQVFHGHTDGVTSVAVSGDGKWAISGSEDATVRVWYVERRPGPLILSGHCQRTLRGHSGWVHSVAMVGPRGLRCVSSGADKTVRVWDLETGLCAQMLQVQGHSQGAALLPPRLPPAGALSC